MGAEDTRPGPEGLLDHMRIWALLRRNWEARAWIGAAERHDAHNLHEQ